jgi:hypothetical protein
VADLASKQDQPPALGAVQPAEQRRRWGCDPHAGGQWPHALHPRPHPGGHVELARHESDALRSWLGRLPRALRQLRAAAGRLAQRRADLGPGTVFRGLREQRRHRRSHLPPGRTVGRRIPAPPDRHDRADAGVGLVHSGLAQHEGRVSGQPQPSEPGVLQLHTVRSVPVQQRHPQSVEPDGHLPRRGEVPAQHPHDVVLRAGHVHTRPAHRSGRRALRRHRDQLPGHRRRRPERVPAHADADLLPGGLDRGDRLEGHHAARGSGL